MSVTVRDVRTICCTPEDVNPVTVKIETIEPGLYGTGCAMFVHRHLAVVITVEEYLKPFLVGKDVPYIEDIWQTAMGMNYWGNGPVLNNALSSMDMALWDIKGRVAGTPLYQLFGGKYREAVPCYTYAEGNSVEDTVKKIVYLKENDYHYVRAQAGGCDGNEMIHQPPEGALSGTYYDPKVCMRRTIKLFEKLWDALGDGLELCHDMHECLAPVDAVGFAKQMEQFQLFFLESILPPERVGRFEWTRSQTVISLATGEPFNNPNEWMDLIKNRRIDRIHVHLGQIGGITPIRKSIAPCDAFGVRTIWHGPASSAPVGRAMNAHLDISSPNFGTQEWSDSICGLFVDRNPKTPEEISPGIPKMKQEYIYLNDKPDIGMDISGEATGRFPCSGEIVTWSWMPPKPPDGASVRPQQK